jgi:hypothetical protein
MPDCPDAHDARDTRDSLYGQLQPMLQLVEVGINAVQSQQAAEGSFK